ncbi:MAG: HAD-IA family hydrolase [Chloroflexi bacterium]|nr:HAD-IA family hydrolase [Chloroflexota bacterium]
MKAVIFDLGRVLVHYHHQATVAAVAALGQLAPTEVHALLARVEPDLGIGNLSALELHQLLIERAGISEDMDAFLAAYAAGITRDEAALAYAVELQARPDLTVGVISNTNEAHVLWLDEFVPELNELDLVIMSNEVGISKPDPAIFELALELLEVEPAQAIFIDDIEANVRAAEALGLHGIIHTDWTITRPALEAWLALPAT